MNTTLIIISTACLAVLTAEASGIMQWIKYKIHIQKLKPLDCPLCLAWWLAILVFVLEKRYWEAPLYAATASIIAIMISRLLKI